FQAEDGIRDYKVTGVQTCALPICAEIIGVDRSVPGSVTLTLRPNRRWNGHEAGQFVQVGVLINGVKHTRCYSPIDAETGPRRTRSEERRVGKERRRELAPDDDQRE